MVPFRLRLTFFGLGLFTNRCSFNRSIMACMTHEGAALLLATRGSSDKESCILLTDQTTQPNAKQNTKHDSHRIISFLAAAA